MASEERGIGYRIWGADNNAYGPVELPALVEWVQTRRVTAGTWVFVEQEGAWRKAAAVPELRMFFQGGARRAPEPGQTPPAGCLKPGALRRIKALASLSDTQLERFVGYVELLRLPQWATVVKQGDHGDALFMVVEGEVRVCLAIPGKETTLATLGPGDLFGEISLFDHGPRSADVLANSESVLLKLTTAAFEKLAEDAPDIATPFLVAVAKTLTIRIRADNKRYRDSLLVASATGPQT